MDSIDDEWDRYCNDDENDNVFDNVSSIDKEQSLTVPICQDLYISTTTKVLYLNNPIDIDNIFGNYL